MNKYIFILYLLFILLTKTNAYAESDFFKQGVSSGDPLEKSVILWTRINFDEKSDLKVEYQISQDEKFNESIQSGFVYTNELRDFTVKVDVKNLKPDTKYFYRFKYKNNYSEIGETKTLPEKTKKLRIAFVSCQNYGAGYFTAYKHIIEDKPDFIVMLGDYIYEHTRYNNRKDESGIARNLESYRKKYKYYINDKFLKEAKRKIPFISIWDDHEVLNDYSGVQLKKENPQMLNEAYQAFFEYTPIREQGDNKIYREFKIGSLVDLLLIDGRQYRDANVCHNIAIGDFSCTPKAHDENITYLGKEQNQWLKDSLKNSTITWKLIANNTTMMEISLWGNLINFDQWDGFYYEKTNFLKFLYENNIKNTLLFTGDIHMFIEGDNLYKGKKASKEFVTSSITSYVPSSVSLIKFAAPLFINKSEFFEPGYRGYILGDFSPRKAEVYFYGMSSLTEDGGYKVLLKKFEVKKELQTNNNIED